MWQSEQTALWCGSRQKLLWLKVAPNQLVVVWQPVVEQVVGNPAAMWFGTPPPSVTVLCHAATWQL